MCIIIVQTKYRGVEQLVARRAHNPEVAGSSPVPATKKIFVPFGTEIFSCYEICAFNLRPTGFRGNTLDRRQRRMQGEFVGAAVEIYRRSKAK